MGLIDHIFRFTKLFLCLLCISPLSLVLGVAVAKYVIGIRIVASMTALFVVGLGVAGFVEEMHKEY